MDKENGFEFYKLKENIRPTNLSDEVKVTVTGDIFEVKYVSEKLGGAIRKLNKDEYLNLKTNQVCKFSHTKNRRRKFANSSKQFA